MAINKILVVELKDHNSYREQKYSFTEAKQFQKTIEAYDKTTSETLLHKYSNASTESDGLKVKKDIDLSKIQKIIEKDMIKNLPPKLKAQLKITQDIANVLLRKKTTTFGTITITSSPTKTQEKLKMNSPIISKATNQSLISKSTPLHPI